MHDHPTIRFVKMGLAVLMATAAATARPQDTAAARSPTEPPSITDQWLARHFVQHVARFARPGPAEASESGYRAAVTILQTAAELDPTRAGILRRLIVAREAVGATESDLGDLLRKLARLDPDDSVTQMRLIQSAMDARQSVAERLRLGERFLEPEVARRLSPSIVSKMAYLVATLRSEQGRADIDPTVLEAACRLDPTNLDAAALTMLETDRRTARHDLRVRALLTLIKADPTNLAAMSDLEAVLRDAGDYADAAATLDVINDLMARRGEVLADDDFARYAVMQATVDGPQAGYDLIRRRQDDFNRFERTMRQRQWAREQQRLYDDAIAKGIAPPPAPTEIPAFEEVTVPLSRSLNSARVLLALLTGDESAISESRAAFDSNVQREIEKIDAADPSTLPDSAIAAMKADRAQLVIEMLQVQLLTNQLDEQIGAQIAALNLDDPGAGRLSAWQALRTGHTEAAIAALEELKAADPLAAVGLSIAYEQTGRARDAGRVLADILAEHRGQVLGVWCQLRLEQMLDRPIPRPREAHLVAAEVGTDLARLKKLIVEPQRFFSLKIEPLDDTVHPLDRLVFNITIRNNAPWPVALGSDRILNSRVALFPVITLVGSRIDRNAPPITLDLQRRFMLKKGESLTVPVELDLTRVGAVASSLAMMPIDVEIQAILDYQVQDNGAIVPASWSLIRESSRVTVEPWATSESLPDLAGQIESSTDEVEFFRAVGQLGGLLHGRNLGTVTEQRSADLLANSNAALEALLARWETLDDRARAWSLFALPRDDGADPSKTIPALEQLDTLAQRDGGPLTTMAWIMTRTTEPDDVMLDAAARSDDVRLQSLAADVGAYLTPSPAEEDASSPVDK